jgi:hypothetical protein
MKNREVMATELRSLGVRPGDVLMVHASLKSIGSVDGGARTIVDALFDASWLQRYESVKPLRPACFPLNRGAVSHRRRH